MKTRELLLGPVEIATQINKGLRAELEKQKNRLRVLGENYPVYPEDFYKKEPRT